ncbi:MAG: glycosyltransferase family 4 protein [Balneola sp.]
MNIAIVGSQLSIHTIRWANSLHDKGHSITVFSMHKKCEKLNKGIIRVRMPFKNPYGYILNIPFLSFKLRNLKPDLVHSFYAFGYSFLVRMTGYRPHLVSVLGSDIYDDIDQFVFRKTIVKNIESADFVCSTSNVMKDQIIKVTNTKKKICVTPFGVDTDKFKKFQKNKEAEFDFVIGTVKRIENKYGIDTLIKAFAMFCKKYPTKKFKLYLVGDGSKVEELINLAKEISVFDKCEFVGKVPHNKIPNWLNKFDLFVALSRLNSESFGVSIIEASACELPVIVSDSGGLPEVVQDGKTGIVVPKENPLEAFKAMDFMYKNKSRAVEMGTKGRERIKRMYDWNSSIEQMEMVYRRIIK